jgi:hypothetical protein
MEPPPPDDRAENSAVTSALEAARLAHESAGQTLQPTALVHEAFLRLIGPDPARPWDGRAHF